MRICPNCKFYNQDKNKRCLKCGWTLEPVEDLPPMRADFKQKRSFAFPRFGRNLFRRVKKALSSEIPEASYRFPFLAAGLSLVFGLGQVYNKQNKKAVLFCLVDAIGLTIVILTITKPYSNWIIFAFVAFLLYTYNDGLVTALKINGQQWTLRYTLAAYSALFFFLGFVTIIGQFFFFSIFKLINVTQPTLEPYIHDGDMIYVDCLTYKFRNPKRGEVIFYTPKPFHIEVPGGLESSRYYIWERRTFERIMGIPGDVVERKNGQFFVNGIPMPPWFQPLVPDNIFETMHFEVPEDRYLAIFSHSPQEMSLGPSWGGRAPALNTPGVILDGWDETCMVEEKEILGRALFIMNPPPHRKFLMNP